MTFSDVLGLLRAHDLASTGALQRISEADLLEAVNCRPDLDSLLCGLGRRPMSRAVVPVRRLDLRASEVSARGSLPKALLATKPENRSLSLTELTTHATTTQKSRLGTSNPCHNVLLFGLAASVWSYSRFSAMNSWCAAERWSCHRPSATSMPWKTNCRRAAASTPSKSTILPRGLHAVEQTSTPGDEATSPRAHHLLRCEHPHPYALPPTSYSHGQSDREASFYRSAASRRSQEDGRLVQLPHQAAFRQSRKGSTQGVICP